MARSDRKTRMRLAAYLRAELRLTLEEIRQRLGAISEPNVSELLRDARSFRLYEESFVYRGPELTAEDNELLHTLQFQSNLQKAIAARLAALGPERVPRVYLYDLGAPDAKEASPEDRVRLFAAQAAPELRRLLTRPKVGMVGVAWGGTIAAMVEALGRSKAPRRTGDPVTVVATCGTPLDHRSALESSSAIAENLSEALNGARGYARTLGITPAYLPSKLHDKGAESVWSYILSAKPYVEIFGTDHLPPDVQPPVTPPGVPLIDRLDAFLTSVSIEGWTLGYGSNKLYPTSDIDPAELEKVVYGDLGGIPLARPGLDQNQQSVLKRVNESWTGVTHAQLQRCVARAYGGHPSSRVPGCILVAVGKRKGRTVYQAVVEEKLVNHLFIDQACAEALAGLLDL